MKNFNYSIFLFAFLILGCFSCKKDVEKIEFNYYGEGMHEMMNEYIDIPEFPLHYTNHFPEYYGGTTNFNKDLATLGRVLFYDKKLSTDETISCASCHKQELAFGDDIDFSVGIEDRRTSRNSLALGAVFSFRVYYGSPLDGGIPFFWDNRASSVQEQSIQTFANENEMGMEMHQVVSRIKNLPYYAPLVKRAFDDSGITDDRVLDAIAIFVNSIGSFNSKYDRALSNSDFQLFRTGDNNGLPATLSDFSSQENAGMALYMTNCGSCHGEVNNVPGKVQANNGLDMIYEDNGAGDFTSRSSDMGKFKVPTLRNIMVTGPYMHDGRFETIEEVVEHYSSGIQLHENLDKELKSSNSALKMNFTAQEKLDLIAFLNTFTDIDFLDPSSNTGKKYSDPFKQ